MTVGDPAAKKQLPFGSSASTGSHRRIHVVDLSYDGGQIKFMPPNTTAIIQPMDKGFVELLRLCMHATLYNILLKL